MLTFVAAFLVALEGEAAAQDTGVESEQDQDYTLDFELFRPYPDAMGYLGVPSAATLGHLQVGVSFWGNYSNDPVVLVYEGERVAPQSAQVSGDDGDGVVDDRFMGNFQVGIGLSRYFSLTVDAPVVLWQDGYNLSGIDSPLEEPRDLIDSGVGDIRVQPKLVALDRDYAPMGLAIQVPVGIPSGNGGSFLGEEAVSLTPSLVAEFSDGSIHAREYTVRGAFLTGYRVRDQARLRDVRLANEFVYGAALGFHPAAPIELVAEFRGTVGGSRSAQNPAEILAGTKFLAGKYASINLAGGAGVLPGVGAPDYRLVFGVSLAPSFDPNSRDSDKDGLSDGVDRCIRDPEDLDEYQDEDGCPDLDNDVDNIPDDQDKCKNDPEDDDGWLDTDGCPDTDNDKDSILDVADRCPNDPEVSNGYMDDDGCPDDKPVDDTDGDGYRDDVDRCPYDGEDFDQYMDEDGCPDLDNDNDGIADGLDACPTVREVFNGISDEDGCPDEGRVVIEKDNIRILEKIYFDTGKATIQSRSYSLLDEIATLIAAHPELTKIRVEGHTDSQGSDVANLKLSQARADSVVAALTQRGVDRYRLDPVGFGEMRPIAGNEDEGGRAENRRVEFIIVDRAQ